VRHARERYLIFLFLVLVLLVRLSLHVDNLLKSTLLEPAILIDSALLFLILEEVNVHLLVLKLRNGRNLLAHIVILGVVPHFNLDYLAVDDVRSLLLHT